VIPAECTVGVDRRIRPGHSVSEACSEFDALVSRLLDKRPGARIGRSVTVAYEPFETPPSSVVYRELMRAATDVLESPPLSPGLRATTDAAFLSDAGIPTVVFGPGNVSEAHRPNEYVELAQVHKAARILALTIVRFVA
jgi:acetylornithine deacetylase/succinyl-diaminopimelate desuccinylase-like protein